MQLTVKEETCATIHKPSHKTFIVLHFLIFICYVTCGADYNQKICNEQFQEEARGSQSRDVNNEDGGENSAEYEDANNDEYENGNDNAYDDESAEDSCGDSIYVTDNGGATISSPSGAGVNYSPNSNCKWMFTSDPNRRISLLITELVIEQSDGCRHDYVEIHDGKHITDPSSGRFCSRVTKKLIESKANNILVVFVSDHEHEESGFKIFYSLVPNNPCNGTAISGSGIITSPGYPGNYPNNEDCWTLINPPDPKEKIYLNFLKIHVEQSHECKLDYVEVFAGLSPDPQVLLGRYCKSDDSVFSQTLNGSTFLIHFHSDNSESDQGFVLKYSDLPPGNDSRTAANNCSKDLKNQTMNVVTFLPHNVSLATGDSYMLHCRADDENIKAMWMKDLTVVTKYQQILPELELLSNNTIVIGYMSWKLEGRYTCILMKPGGAEAMDVWVKLTVDNTPNACNLRFDHTPEDKALMETTFIYLRCSAQHADVTWEKDGESLEYYRRANVTMLPGLLLINSAAKEDSGTYTCIATSHHLGCSIRKEAYISVDPLVQQSCGHLYTSTPCEATGKIVGGHRVKKGTIPWQAMLWEKQDGLFCGGSLVADEWVVTAAHCISKLEMHRNRVVRAEDVFIKLGKHNRLKTERQEQVEGAKKIIVHPHFNNKTYDNDIALIRLNNRARQSPNIMPICLGSKRHFSSLVYERAVGKITGWGQLADSSFSSRYLMEVHLPVVRDQVCNMSIDFGMTKNMFCAGFAEKIMEDACKGDSGGPFAIKQNLRWYLAGIISWGNGCSRAGEYGFYTKVGNYYNWINNHIKNPDGTTS